MRPPPLPGWFPRTHVRADRGPPPGPSGPRLAAGRANGHIAAGPVGPFRPGPGAPGLGGPNSGGPQHVTRVELMRPASVRSTVNRRIGTERPWALPVGWGAADLATDPAGRLPA